MYQDVCVWTHVMCNVFPSPGKNRRLKQAKEEAQAEIEQYRLQREKEFKTKEAAVRPVLFYHITFTAETGFNTSVKSSFSLI